MGVLDWQFKSQGQNHFFPADLPMTYSIKDVRAILKTDIGFYIGIILWPLLALISTSHRIHVLWACQKMLPVAHINTKPFVLNIKHLHVQFIRSTGALALIFFLLG